jgi:hypothetical protein
MRRVTIATLVLVVATGCTPDKPQPSPSGKREFDQTKYVQCLREHGAKVNEVDGGIGIEANDEAQEAKNTEAKKACRQLGPDGGEPVVPDPAQLEQLRKQAQCLRDHGLDVKDPGPPDYDVKINVSGDDVRKADAAQRACLPGQR